MHQKRSLSRRGFLKRAGALALGGVAAPTIIPASALGADGTVAPSNRLVYGAIGTGGRGTSDLKSIMSKEGVQAVAVCDVDARRRAKARHLIEERYADRSPHGKWSGCVEYSDFRQLLARDDIDVVSISTPDHWHTLIAVAAARAGKDIYCQKPLTLTIQEGRIMSDTVARYGRVLQVGSQQRSDRDFRFACELVRNGRIGQLEHIEVGLPVGSQHDVVSPQPVPSHFDYNMWLGPAPYTPYHEERCHYNFRFHFDYSGGRPTDWGAHHCDIAHWAMGTDTTGPVQVEGQGVFPDNGPFNTSITYRFVATYQDGVRMICSSEFERGVRFVGQEGWIFISRDELKASPQKLLGSVIGPNEIHLYESTSHSGNFLECVRTRREPVASVEVGHRSISVPHLGNISMRLGRKIRWDPDREVILDDPEAQRMTSRPMRSPWHL